MTPNRTKFENASSKMPPSNWLVLQCGAGNPAWNMALDEALMENASAMGSPVLRFYSWTEQAATFGYSQRYAEVQNVTLLRPLVRRPTGGGLVPHDVDWTYSLTFPPGHWWYDLKATESYKLVHEWLRDAFARMSVPSEVAPCCRKEIPGQCFVGWEQYDLLWCGRKIAGAAQRRSKAALLIQGSVQPPPIPLDREQWETSMLEAASTRWDVNWATLDFTDNAPLHQRARELRDQKYSQDAFNKGR